MSDRNPQTGAEVWGGFYLTYFPILKFWLPNSNSRLAEGEVDREEQKTQVQRQEKFIHPDKQVNFYTPGMKTVTWTKFP